MLKISRYQKELLDKVGLLKYRKVGFNPQDQNFVVTNREHTGRNKRYYITEEPEVLMFLGRYEGLNLQSISQAECDKLIAAQLVYKNKIQHWGEYVPNAILYENESGEWHMKKIAKLMIFLGYWKANVGNPRKNNPNQNSGNN